MRVRLMQRVDRLLMAYARLDSCNGVSAVAYSQQILYYATDALAFIIFMIIIINILHYIHIFQFLYIFLYSLDTFLP